MPAVGLFLDIWWEDVNPGSTVATLKGTMRQLTGSHVDFDIKTSPLPARRLMELSGGIALFATQAFLLSFDTRDGFQTHDNAEWPNRWNTSISIYINLYDISFGANVGRLPIGISSRRLVTERYTKENPYTFGFWYDSDTHRFTTAPGPSYQNVYRPFPVHIAGPAIEWRTVYSRIVYIAPPAQEWQNVYSPALFFIDPVQEWQNVYRPIVSVPGPEWQTVYTPLTGIVETTDWQTVYRPFVRIADPAWQDVYRPDVNLVPLTGWQNVYRPAVHVGVDYRTVYTPEPRIFGWNDVYQPQFVEPQVTSAIWATRLRPGVSVRPPYVPSLYIIDDISGRAIYVTTIDQFGVTAPENIAFHKGRVFVLDDGTDLLYSIAAEPETTDGFTVVSQTHLGLSSQDHFSNLASHQGRLYTIGVSAVRN